MTQERQDRAAAILAALDPYYAEMLRALAAEVTAWRQQFNAQATPWTALDELEARIFLEHRRVFGGKVVEP
jgi:hypothetical protein